MPDGARGSRRARRGATQQSVFSRNMEEAARALYHCNYCHRDISDNIRIKCAVCADFDLCVECFGVGVEINGHSNSHAYRVMDNLSFPIFHPSWGSDEELLLLEAVEIYGLGNWPAVSEHVGTKATHECRAHYHTTYIDPPSCPLPTPAPEMAGLDVAKLAEVAKRSCGRKRMRLDPTAAAQQLKQLLQQEGGAPSPQQQQQQQGEDAGGVQVKQEEQEQQQRNNASSRSPLPATGAGGAAAAAAAGVKDEREGGAAAAAAAAAAAGSPMDIDGVKQEQQQQQDATLQPDAAASQQKQQQPHQGTPGHAKVSFRQRTADEAAAAAAAGATPAQPDTQQQHASTGALGKVVPGSSPPQPQQRQRRQSQSQQQQQPEKEEEDEGAEEPDGAAGAAAAGAGGQTATTPAAAGGGDAPRVRGSGPQLDMLTGYHAKRLEFDPEWDHDAETSIAEIEFREGEPPAQEAAKLRLLEIYNARLDERARRQAAILELGLLNVRRMQGSDKRRLPGEKEKHAQMRVFARYQPPGSHEGFVEGLLLEGRLRLRIAELQAHRAAGRRTLAEVEEAEMVEAAAKKKAKEKALREAMLAGMSLAQAGQQQQAEAAESAAAGGGPGGAASLGGYRSTASALSVYRQRQGVGLDISALPGHEHLTSREAELCAGGRLLPSHYLSLKDVMMRDAQVHGHISRNDARGFFRLEPARCGRVWEVLCASGWLKDTRPEEAEDKRRWPRKKVEAVAAAQAAAAAAAQQQQQQIMAAAAASLAVGFPPAPGKAGGGAGGTAGAQRSSSSAAAAAVAAAAAAVAATAAAGGAGGGGDGAAAAASGGATAAGGSMALSEGVTGSGAVASGMTDGDE